MLLRLGWDSAYCVFCVYLLAQEQNSLSMSPLTIFVASAITAICAGAASLWRNKESDITSRELVSHVLNMGTCGASFSMLLYYFLEHNRGVEWMIIGLTGLLSLGGMKIIEMLSTIAQKYLLKRFIPGLEEMEGSPDE